jgi:aspartate racemase
MIGILGGMGTQAGLDFCNKLAMLNRGKIDQKYPLFILYNKSNIPGRPENLHKYNKVLKSLSTGCLMLQKNKCKFIVIPCNTAHYWYDDLQRKTKIPIINMPKEVYLHAKKNCKKNSKIGILATEATLKTGVYDAQGHSHLGQNQKSGTIFAGMFAFLALVYGGTLFL